MARYQPRGVWAADLWPFCTGCGVEMTGRRRRFHDPDCRDAYQKRVEREARERDALPRRKTGPKPKGAHVPCAVCGERVYRSASALRRNRRAYCPEHVGQQPQRQRTRVCKCGCGSYPEVQGRFYVEGHRPRDTRSEEERAAALKLKRRKQAVRRYGMTLATYAAMLEAQGGGCAICGRTREEEGKNLAIDHDHACCPQENGSCGLCVRGILCDGCNQRVMVHERADRQPEYPEAEEYLDRFAREGSPVLTFISAA